MARPNLLRRKLAEGQTCIGPIFQEFWSPELFEFCGLAGFDYVIADGEHAGVDPHGDALGVHKHPVAVENDEPKRTGHTGIITS